MTVDVIGGGLDAVVTADVLGLVGAATWHDGAEPLGETSLLALRHGQASPVHAVARLDGEVAGYAQLDPATAAVELVVAPSWRRRGIGGALVQALRDEASRASGGELRFWSHGDLPAARAFADAMGLTSVRELWFMRRPLAAPSGLGLFDLGSSPDADDVGPDLVGSLGADADAAADLAADAGPDLVGSPAAASGLPGSLEDTDHQDRSGLRVTGGKGSGERLRPFVVGRDEDAWVALNRVAFATHPEQGRLGRADLEARMAEDWWDPAGLLLAGPAYDLAGFVWTKLTADADADADADAAGGLVGEIYVLAVNPAHQGHGLGRRLLRAGLDSMAARGAAWAVLYVESDNLPALRLYRQTGFVVANRDVQYAF